MVITEPWPAGISAGLFVGGGRLLVVRAERKTALPRLQQPVGAPRIRFWRRDRHLTGFPKALSVDSYRAWWAGRIQVPPAAFAVALAAARSARRASSSSRFWA